MSEALGAASLRGHTAGFVSRATAYVLDAMVVAVLWSSGAFALDAVLRVLGLDDRTVDPELGGALLALGVSLAGVVLVYQALGVWLFGKTVGKLVLGLRVVRADGTRLSLTRSALRAAAYSLSMVTVLGCLWVLVDRHRRAWHDLLVGTVVVYDWEARPRALLPAPGDDRLVPLD